MEAKQSNPIVRESHVGFESPSLIELLSLSSFPVYVVVRRPSMAFFTLLYEGEHVSSSKSPTTSLFCPLFPYFPFKFPCLHCCSTTFDGPLYATAQRRVCLLFKDSCDLPVLPSKISVTFDGPVYVVVRRRACLLFEGRSQ
uniref:Uncharacterized protein n=1 Tax=Nelumbo nucifera TaxID=4432 RepID=A0A822ZNL9_NELNU|nr:TPA_asm: hypothetical protein HUJ06_017531 [Nelumbo nucifera]